MIEVILSTDRYPFSTISYLTTSNQLLPPIETNLSSRLNQLNKINERRQRAWSWRCQNDAMSKLTDVLSASLATIQLTEAVRYFDRTDWIELNM